MSINHMTDRETVTERRKDGEMDDVETEREQIMGRYRQKRRWNDNEMERQKIEIQTQRKMERQRQIEMKRQRRQINKEQER